MADRRSKQQGSKQQGSRRQDSDLQGPKLLRLPDGSRSVQSPWVWRGFLFMSLIALGFAVMFGAGGRTFYAGAWAFITAGWFGISMWLWRRHVRDDNEWAASQQPQRQQRARRSA